MLDSQLILQPQPRVTERIACLTDEVQCWRHSLNIRRHPLQIFNQSWNTRSVNKVMRLPAYRTMWQCCGLALHMKVR